MLQRVEVGPLRLDAYRGVVPDGLLDDLLTCARALRGARVLHVNATPYGGGVSELLRSIVPLLGDLGIVADWKIIRGDERFFRVTKKIHNGLQGASDQLTESEREAYLGASQRNAQALEEDYDFVFLHDPQPAAILGLRGTGHGRWIWRCHIDTAAPDPRTWAFLRSFLEPFDAAVFTMAQFVPPDLPIHRVEIMPPGIDPLSPKNMPLSDATARSLLHWLGVDPAKPLVTQVSRFDPWKDPLGVIEAYRLARGAEPDLQLALVGSMALDDPEGWEIYREIEATAHADPAIHLFTNLTGVGNVEVNAFQRLSRVMIQKLIREGFGLVVSEALWKGTAVVAGRAGGIPLQMADGVGGLLVEGIDECARAMITLLNDPERADHLGRLGQARVRAHFLVPRLALDELSLMRALAGARAFGPEVGLQTLRDPGCGMAVPRDHPPTAARGDVEYRFCSEACRAAFTQEPERYMMSGTEPAEPPAQPEPREQG